MAGGNTSGDILICFHLAKDKKREDPRPFIPIIEQMNRFSIFPNMINNPLQVYFEMEY